MSDGDAESDEETEEADPGSTAGPAPPERPVPGPTDGDEGSPGGDAREDAGPGSGDDGSGPGAAAGNGAAGDPRAEDEVEGVEGPGSPARTGSGDAGDPSASGRSVGTGNRDAGAERPGVTPEGRDVDPEGIDVEELTGPVRKLDPKVRYVWVLGSVMGSLVLGGIAGVVGFVAFDRPVVGPAVFLALLGLGAVLAVLRYRSWSYEVREDSLYLERGVLTHTRTVVPYVRIQHVDASRGPVERALGLATAVVYTAGSRGADVSIPGLTTDRADDLQERLKRLAIAAEGEDAV